MNEHNRNRLLHRFHDTCPCCYRPGGRPRWKNGHRLFSCSFCGAVWRWGRNPQSPYVCTPSRFSDGGHHLNYKKNIQPPTRRIPFFVKCWHAIRSFFAPKPRAIPVPAPEEPRPVPSKCSGPGWRDTAPRGFGNPLTRCQPPSPGHRRRRSWWIPPDERVQIIVVRDCNGNPHRKLLKKVRRCA